MLSCLPAQRGGAGVVAIGCGGFHGLRPKIRERIAQRLAADLGEAHKILVSQVCPQAIRAQQQHIARLQPPPRRDGHLRQRRVSAQAAFNVVAHRVTVHLGLGDQALAQQHLDMAVIARALQDLRLAQLINAAIADMRPICRRILHQSHRAGGARPCLDAQSRAELHDFFVCSAQ